MSENLFIFNGVLTATAGSAATAEPLPEANVDANGKVTVVQPGKTSNATSLLLHKRPETLRLKAELRQQAPMQAWGAEK